MTRTSPERDAVERGADVVPPRAWRRFAVRGGAVIAALALAAGVLAAAAFERGPRLHAVSGDTDRAVVQADVVLTMSADQPLSSSSIDGLSVEPAAPVRAEVSGSTIRVRFVGLLDHAQHYRLVVPRVRAELTGTVSTFAYEFSTPPLQITTLERAGRFAAGGVDSVVRHDLSDGSVRVLARAPRIQEFATLGAAVAVLERDAEERSSIRVVGGDGGDDPDGGGRGLVLPGDGTPGLLRASDDGQRLGYVYTGPAADGGMPYTNALFVVDLARPDDRPQPVVGVDGEVVRASAWQFVPGTAYLVVQGADSTLSLVDAAGRAGPRLLGQLGDMRAFLPGSTTLVLDTAQGLSLLDLSTGTVDPIGDSVARFRGTSTVLLDRATSLRWVTGLSSVAGGGGDSAGERFTAVTRVGADAPRVVFRAEPAGSRIDAVCPSPSGRYAAAVVVPAGSVSDGYPARASWVGVRTVVFDASSGAPVATIPGARSDWCE